MRVCTTFPPRERDLRLDLFRGWANWAIFLDHIPHEVLNSITTRNYGFSDATGLFVFISGYTAALVNSLQVFCIGIVLSFCAHAAIETSLNSLWVQILVGTIGILSMTASAYCWTWHKRQDRMSLLRQGSPAPRSQVGDFDRERRSSLLLSLFQSAQEPTDLPDGLSGQFRV
jgi:hypothetical protein